MNEPIIDQNLLVYILSLFGIPGNAAADTGNLRSEPSSAQPDWRLRTARSIIRFMDRMPDGFLIYHADPAAKIIYANLALLHICQCDSPEDFRKLTGNSFQGFVHPDDGNTTEQSIRNQITQNRSGPDYITYRIKRKDGAVRWIEDYRHLIRTDTGGELFFVFINDATEKNEFLQKEWALQRQIDRYHAEMKLINQEYLRRLEVIEGLSIHYESILYADLELDIIQPYRLSNRTTLQFENTNKPRSFSWYISNYVNVWVHPEDRKSVTEQTSPEYIRRKLSAQNTFYLNYKVIKDSEIQYLQLRIVNVTGSSQVSQIVMGYRRVDDEIRKEMEQKRLLEEALTNANLAITAKNTFLSNMSHDMRTPLNAIFGFTALARGNLYDQTSLEYYLNKISSSGEQLLDLIDKVLEIAWTGSDDIHITETKCNLTEILETVSHAYLTLAEEKNITITSDTSGLTHCDICSDQDKLERFLSYLTHNAVKYTPKGGHITIRATELNTLPNDHAVYQFAVEDNGIGISPEFMERIYEPFEREKNTTYSGVIGTGLGLTIVKNIVTAMGGTIDVKSAIGKGTRFTVTLRLKTQVHPVSFNMSTDDTIAYLTGHKILLVEDNEINLEIETAILEGMGFHVDTAENGRIAVEMIKKAAPDEYALVLMDIQMPVMNGRQAARAIRGLKNNNLARIPIIALSADAFESDKRKSIESGMDAHLPKPIDIPVLLETIAKTIQMHKYLYGDA